MSVIEIGREAPILPRREIVDRFINGGFSRLPALSSNSKIIGAPLRYFKVFPSLPLTVASERFCTGSNGWK